MCKSMFRALKASEVDARVARVTEKGAQILLYKNARCDMNILDETVGAMNWMRQHGRDNANCIVSIWDDKKQQWISKEDTGTESNTESEKGLASDSFKRACVNWGIGRELYTAPVVWVGAQGVNIVKDGTRYKTYDTFDVESMEVNDGEMVAVSIINHNTGKRVFTWKKSAPVQEKAQDPRNAAWVALATALKYTNKQMFAAAKACVDAKLAPSKPLNEYTETEYYGLLDAIRVNAKAA